ncbi:MAG: hypothetical protein ACE5H9_06775 [Anaerolineae bacterium]
MPNRSHPGAALSLLLILAVAALACRVTVAVAPTPTATATLTPSPTATATATASPTPAPTETSTPPPPTATPTAPPPAPSPTPPPPPTGTATPAPTATPVDTPTPAPPPPTEPPPPPPVDFVVLSQRLKHNEENGGYSPNGSLENGYCGYDHTIFIWVLDVEGNPLDGIVLGDTFNNVEVASGDKGPGHANIPLQNNTMEILVKRHIDGTSYTSQVTFPLTAADELIPPLIYQAAGFCNDPEECAWRQANNQGCRGHFSYEVVFQKTH